MAQASDGVQAALQAAKNIWPAATLTALNATAPCGDEVIADAPGIARNGLLQIRVRCTARPGWVRYIGVRIEQSGKVAVLRTPLGRGQTLSTPQIEWQARDLLQAPADALTEGAAIGHLLAARDLSAGSVLRASQFTTPKAIQRGQSVTLVSRAAGMEVRAPGEALADASLGSRLQVRNRASRRIVEGIAAADGTVEVAL